MRALALALALALSGCGTLIPKKVELFQREVKAVPVKTEAHVEVEKQAVKLAGEKAREAERIATADGSQAAIPAAEAAVLSEAVSRSLGPPENPWSGPVASLATKVDTLAARLDQRLDDYRDRVRRDVGKDIEGTGLVQVPYLLWLGGAAFLALLVYLVLRTILQAVSVSNPPVALGLSMASLGSRFAGKALREVVAGGEEFKKWVKAEINDPAIQARVLEAFRVQQERKQSPEVQAILKEV